MGIREYSLGYTHGLTGRFPMHHRKGRPYVSENARAGYLRGYRAGAEVARQRAITREAAHAMGAVHEAVYTYVGPNKL